MAIAARWLAGAWLCAAPLWGQEAPSASPPAPPEAVRRAVAYLVASQNPDGSWGSHRQTMAGVWGAEGPANPETHRSWRVATTGLCCIALMDHGPPLEATEALARGLDFLVKNADLKRPSDWDTDHVWGLIFSLEALARAELHASIAKSEDAFRPAAKKLLSILARCQAPSGGWDYYDFDTRSTPPSWATSFTTASALSALHQARKAGWSIPSEMARAAAAAVRRSRLPDGGYTYTVSAIPLPTPGRETIHNVRGSLARIQAGNLALFLEGGDLSPEDLARGLDLLFAHHRFLDVAVARPIPHEAYYWNSGYFYLYGHAYAGRILKLLPENSRERYRGRLDGAVLKLQNPDGSFWDWPFHGYARPYGTAFALMALAR